MEDQKYIRDLTARVTELETLFTHVQRLVNELNEVLIQQTQRLDRLESRQQQIARQVETHDDKLSESRDALDEKPPHY